MASQVNGVWKDLYLTIALKSYTTETLVQVGMCLKYAISFECWYLLPVACRCVIRGVSNDWNFVGHLWDYFWKMKFGLKISLFHSYFERWKLDINNVMINYGYVTADYGNLQKLVYHLKLRSKLQDFTDWNLKYESWNLSESWNMGPYLSIFEILWTIFDRYLPLGAI